MSNSIEELTAVTNLIHLSFHRNRNQHRLAKWWSSLSQLKRHIQKLVSELSVLDTAAQYEIKGKSKSESKYVRTAREKVEARVEFLENWLVPSCYL
jgi:ribonuclease MRP protein subunit RMP1